MNASTTKHVAKEARPSLFVEIVAAVFALATIPWAASKLWEWFVVPLGVPSISYWHGMGFAVIIWFCKAICAKSHISCALMVAIAFSAGFFAMLNMR